MKYDSVLDQQSISGKIVSLILCVWKPCYMKSGHIFVHKSLNIKIFIPETYENSLSFWGAACPDPLIYMPTTWVYPPPPLLNHGSTSG